MKILVLNGSPKKEKSDTLHLTRAFLQGMQDVSAQEIEFLHVIEKDIRYCTGCLACMRNGGECVHKDDMGEILEQIIAADVLLCSFPLYYYGMPAPLKALIDRTLPLSSLRMKKVGDHYEHEANRARAAQKYVMICGCGFPNRENNFEPAVVHFRRVFPGDSTVITVSETPMLNVPEAQMLTAPLLEIVRQAGREYAQAGAVSAETMQKLQVPMMPQEAYAQMVNGLNG